MGKVKKNQRIIKATITASDLASGGLLTTGQANKFIDHIFESTDFLVACRTEKMTRPVQEFDKIGIGSRIMIGRTSENQDVSSYVRSVEFGKLTLTAKQYDLPWELSEKALRDNIERGALAGRIAKMMATQMGVDTEDVAFNGNTDTASATTTVTNLPATSTTIAAVTLTDASTWPKHGDAGYAVVGSEYLYYQYRVGNILYNVERAQNSTTAALHGPGSAISYVKHVLMGHDDGWLHKCYNGDANYVDLSAFPTATGYTAGNIHKEHFFQLFRALPSKYRRGSMKSRLRWIISPTQKALWDEYLTDRNTSAGDAVLAGNEFKPLGISFIEVASFPEDMIMLADPMNFLLGVYLEMYIKRTDSDKESIYQHKIFYNATTEMDFEIEREEAVAYGDGLSLQA
jgi:hypothetical protein